MFKKDNVNELFSNSNRAYHQFGSDYQIKYANSQNKQEFCDKYTPVFNNQKSDMVSYADQYIINKGFLRKN